VTGPSSAPDLRLILPVSALFALALTAVLLQPLWPGLMSLAAPLACPAGYPDAFVAKQAFSIQGETRTSLSLQCMSANGAIRQGSQLLAMLPWFVGIWAVAATGLVIRRLKLGGKL